jgi:hypothetical protein
MSERATLSRACPGDALPYSDALELWSGHLAPTRTVWRALASEIVTTMATSVGGNGYYLINGGGTVWAFGDAPYLGNAYLLIRAEASSRRAHFQRARNDGSRARAPATVLGLSDPRILLHCTLLLTSAREDDARAFA